MAFLLFSKILQFCIFFTWFLFSFSFEIIFFFSSLATLLLTIFSYWVSHQRIHRSRYLWCQSFYYVGFLFAFMGYLSRAMKSLTFFVCFIPLICLLINKGRCLIFNNLFFKILKFLFLKTKSLCKIFVKRIILKTKI